MDRTVAYKPFGCFRLLLAALVVFQHIHPVLPRDIVINSQHLELGTLAVYVFFVASGYIITEAVTRIYPERPWAFLANRCIRLIPTVAFVIVIAALLWAFLIAEGEGIWSRTMALIGQSLLRLFPFTGRFEPEYSIMGVMWALRVEFTFYLFCFGMLFASPYLKTSASKAGAAIVGTVVLLAFFTADCTREVPTMLRFIPYFLFGAALYFASHSKATSLVVVAELIGAMALVGIVIEQINHPALHEAAGFNRDRLAQTLILFALIAIFAALSFLRLDRCRSRVDGFLGDLSFPLYVAHDPTILIASLYFAPSVTVAIATFVAVIVGAMILYFLLERHLIRLRALIRKTEIR